MQTARRQSCDIRAQRFAASARVDLAWLALLGSAAVVVLCVLLLRQRSDRALSSARAPLEVFCAAALKGPVEAVAREYEKEFGVPVQLSFGASQTLLTSLEVARRGDLYLPADDSFLQLARSKGLIAECIPLARLHAVVAVAQGNPHRLRSLADLLRSEVRLGQANPDAAAIGKLTREALQASGHWEALARRTVVFKPTLHDVANDVKLGTVDAGIIWDAVARQYAGLETLKVPELDGVQAHVSLAVLHSSPQPAAALRFARYLAARDKGLAELARQGFAVEAGDRWAELPKLVLYSGAMLRPAIEETLTRFEQREGVQIDRVYNGCGILTAQMRAEATPDAYFACDVSFMDQVRDLFLDSFDVSANPLVILVPKGNPLGIQSLADLTRRGLRLGLAHEQQSALGALTRTLLLTNGVYAGVRANLKVESATGDFLVNQLRTGSLDAVIAYRSNALLAGDHLEALPIDSPAARALQPLAVARQTPYPQLAARLCLALLSPESRARFEASGFGWRADAGRRPALSDALPRLE